MKQKLYDIHSHTLPKIDDGSSSWEETMQMVRQAYKSGTTDLAITHHIIRPADYEKESDILEKFAVVKERLEKAEIPLTLHLAAELYYSPDLELTHRISTFNNNGRYFLVEFPMQGIPKFCEEKFFEFIVNGKNPILAHPERNLGILMNPMRAYEFVQKGVLLQMNAGSVTGMYGEPIRQLAVKLLDARLIHFVGSDGHNVTRRPLVIREAYDFIVKKYGAPYATRIFHEYPWRAMHGDDISIEEPRPIEAEPARNPSKLLKMLGF